MSMSAPTLAPLLSFFFVAFAAVYTGLSPDELEKIRRDFHRCVLIDADFQLVVVTLEIVPVTFQLIRKVCGTILVDILEAFLLLVLGFLYPFFVLFSVIRQPLHLFVQLVIPASRVLLTTLWANLRQLSAPDMVVKNYGVWVGEATRYEAQKNQDDSKSPHIELFFDDGDGEKRAAINVKSIGKDSRLVYWLVQDVQHPITEVLRRLRPGFHSANEDEDNLLGLDFYREDPPLLNLEDGRILPHDIPGPDNDILDQMRPLLDKAVDEKRRVYIFGSAFRDRQSGEQGIHDVHMNQGSLPRFDNGVFEDGALFIHHVVEHEHEHGHEHEQENGDGADQDQDRFDAVFLAFASQRLPTDDTSGLALSDSKPLAEIARLSDAQGNLL